MYIFKLIFYLNSQKMEENNDLKELSIILGLKENAMELNKIILDKKESTFLGCISNILFSDDINNLYEKIDANNANNEMIDNFINKAQIEGVAPIKLELYKNSNFIENIKGNEEIIPKPYVNYTEKYLFKLQNDFIKEEKDIVPPIEIKEQNIKKYEDKKKNYKNRNRQKKKKDEANEENINENKEIDEEKEIKVENKEEEDKKEIKENIENEISQEQNKDFEDYEIVEDKKGDGNNSQRNNNRRNYNKKYNKNKGHKEYRQNYNSRKFKNYK